MSEVRREKRGRYYFFVTASRQVTGLQLVWQGSVFLDLKLTYIAVMMGFDFIQTPFMRHMRA